MFLVSDPASSYNSNIWNDNLFSSYVWGCSSWARSLCFGFRNQGQRKSGITTANVCEYMQIYANICKYMQIIEYMRIYTNICEYIRMYANICKYMRIYANIYEYMRIYYAVCKIVLRNVLQTIRLFVTIRSHTKVVY